MISKKGNNELPKKEIMNYQKRKVWITKKGNNELPNKESMNYQKRK